MMQDLAESKSKPDRQQPPDIWQDADLVPPSDSQRS